MEHRQHDWEQQREQLSALLDQELDEQQRAELEAHLPTCAECRAELESLRRTRALLHALPQPTLPRSFALPVAAASLPAHPRPAAPAPVRRVRRRSAVQVLQWLSSTAAVLGILFLLFSAIAGHTAATGETNSSAALGSSQPPVSSSEQPAGIPTTPPERTASTHPEAPSPVPTASNSTSTPDTHQGQSFDSNNPPGGTGPNFGFLVSSSGLGILLLLLSACGFAISWALRRRW